MVRRQGVTEAVLAWVVGESPSVELTLDQNLKEVRGKSSRHLQGM